MEVLLKVLNRFGDLVLVIKSLFFETKFLKFQLIVS